MPNDITMCHGGECVLQENCLRKTGIIFGRVNYFGNPPYNKTMKKCDYFLTDKPNHNRIAELAYLIWEKSNYQKNNELSNWLEAENSLIEKIRNSC